jgi:hypothetical protein
MLLTINDYDKSYVIYNEPVDNSVIEQGKFIRLSYSTDVVQFNAIYILTKFVNCMCERNYGKYKHSFPVKQNSALVNYLSTLEHGLLSKSGISGKTCQHKLDQSLKDGFLKMFDPSLNGQFVLRISGIWETPQEYGLAYKFIPVKPSVV